MVYGCLDQHIWDRQLCIPHAATFIEIFNSKTGRPCNWPTCKLKLDMLYTINSNQVDYRQLYSYQAIYGGMHHPMP